MTKTTKNNIDDSELFKQAMQGTTPLNHSKILPPPPALTPLKPLTKEELREWQNPFSDYDKHEWVGSEDSLDFFRTGIAHKTLRKLRQGQYNVEANLDLHGLKIDEARESLYQFLLFCQKQDIRHVLIIHGKGRSGTKPILKNMLNQWLRQSEQILAFCSAAAKDGSKGALYVLLKRGISWK